MKTILYFSAILFLGSLGLKAQNFSDNFDSYNNRNPLVANCWEFWGTDVKSNNKINGSKSTRSGQASSMTNKKQVRTPFLDISAGATVSFSHKISKYRSQDTRILDVVLVDANGNESAPIYTHTYGSGSVVNASFSVGSTGVYRVAMQHYGSGGQGRGHIDDLVITNAVYAADPGNGCQPIVTVADADNDGVADDRDAFPNDPNKAFQVYSNAGGYGSVAFEDLWPAQGDYDFNDLVTDYRIEYILDAANEVVEMNVAVYVRAVGAGIINGLGIEFPSIATASAVSVSGSSITDNYIALAASGAEAGQSNLVIIPFDNAESVINRNGGAFYNTSTGQTEGISDSIKVKVVLNGGVTLTDATYLNPFVIKDRVRGQEIHLADYPPTDLADLTLFGTGDDDSDPNSGRYYKTVNNYPWAIATPVKFTYPSEKKDIVNAHNKFAAWAQSSGNNFADWYTDQPGYRALINLF
jgi:LruC domain-containing protein